MQRYFAKEKQGDYVTLFSSDYYHIKTVMRMQVGETVEVVYDTTLYICEILPNDVIHILEKQESIQNGCPVTLCISLLNDSKMSFILQKATELGVYKIIPILTTRSVVKWDTSKQEKKLERWYRICKEASEQSKRISIPILENVTAISDLKGEGLKIVCSTKNKETTIKQVLNNSFEQVLVAIGPEGGFTDLEEEELNRLGFISTSLGDTIMRVETVPIYIMSVIQYDRM